MPKAGLEPARVSPPPPQDGVSTKFHHFGNIGYYRKGARLWQHFDAIHFDERIGVNRY